MSVTKFPDSLKGLTLWRYINLAKLIDILSTRTLHFAALNSFEDQYEGTVPIGWQSPIMVPSEQVSVPAGPDGLESVDIPIDEGDFLKDEKIRGEMFVSCWHNSEHESAAMWHQCSRGSGIAIKTTSDRLVEALQKAEEEVEIAPIGYTEVAPPFLPHKLIAGTSWTVKLPIFDYEKEVRAAVRRASVDQKGLRISVGVEALIEEIYISPELAGFRDAVADAVNNRYGFDKPVLPSRLRI